MFANSTTIVKGIEIQTGQMTAEQIETLKTWDEAMLRPLAVVKLVVNRKTFMVVPGFIDTINAKVSQASAARRNYESARSSRLTREAIEYIREILGVDYDEARMVIRKIRSL